MYDIEVGNDKRMKTLNADTHQFQRISPLGPLKSSEFNDFLYIIGRFLISKSKAGHPTLPFICWKAAWGLNCINFASKAEMNLGRIWKVLHFMKTWALIDRYSLFPKKYFDPVPYRFKLFLVKYFHAWKRWSKDIFGNLNANGKFKLHFILPLYFMPYDS